MQIMHEQLVISGHNTIKVKWDEFPHFTFPWHYHRELEIVYVINSYGNRYVGDSVEEFNDGDLVLLGSNLPHFWKNHDDFYQNNSDLQVKAIVVQFPFELIDVGHLPEFRNIHELITRSERGIQFLKPALAKVEKKLNSLLIKEGLDRYLTFIEILDQLATTKHFRYLGSPDTKHSLPKGIDSRLEKILWYLNNNFTEEQEVAKLGNLIAMNETAFCRYFKANTGKTIVEYIHDMRIGYACKLLLEKRNTVSEIAFQCGFNNISHFNRVFKRKTNYTPSNYVKKMVGN